MGDFDQNSRYVEHIYRGVRSFSRGVPDTKNVDFIDSRYHRGVKKRKGAEMK
jgi:hypothetical protein